MYLINVYESAKEIDKRRQTCFNLPITGGKRILATRLGSMERKGNNRVRDGKKTNIIFRSYPNRSSRRERKKRNLSISNSRTSTTYHHIYIYIYNTLHKEISTFYDYVNKKCVQH